MTKTTFFKALRKLVLTGAIFSVFMQCSEDELIGVYRVKIIVDSDTLKAVAPSPSAGCDECTYVVPAGVTVIDGNLLELKPGDIIGLNSQIVYGTLEFHNLAGSTEQPIIIKNCGGTASIVATNKWHAVKTINSKHYRITGGSAPGVYGINVQGGEMGLKLDGLSTNFEIDHLEISNQSFAGIMAKTDPNCDDATIRGNFTMYDVSFHDNYIHNTGGEGLYIGSSAWDGMQKECGIRLPHEIKGVKIFNNIVHNAGWEAIQVGCAIEGSEIYNNTVKNYGTANKLYQNNGIQLGAGTGGDVYNNLIKDGTGNGMIIMGTGDNVIYNNIIVNAGEHGIFCDERYTPGEGFKFINNTILNPKLDGIRIYSELVPMNTVINNIIANPGSYSSYSGALSSENPFVFLMNSDVNVNLSNNLYVVTEGEIRFVDPANDNYRLKLGSPAVDFGMDIANYQIPFDFYKASRLKGAAYDAGASEF